MTYTTIATQTYPDPQNQWLNGKHIIRTSAGIPYVIISTSNAAATIQVWKGNSSNPTSFTRMDSINSPASRSYSLSCAIDSNDVIHISHDCGWSHPTFLRYHTFDTSTDLFVTIDEIVYTTIYYQYGSNIAIDKNDIPHISFIEMNDSTGEICELQYTNRIGGSWKAPVIAQAIGNGDVIYFYYVRTDIVIDDSNLPVVGTSYWLDQASPYRKEVYVALGNVNNAASFTSYEVMAEDCSEYPSDFALGIDSYGNHYVIYSTITDVGDDTYYKAGFKKHTKGASWNTWTAFSAGIENDNVVSWGGIWILRGGLDGDNVWMIASVTNDGVNDLILIIYSGSSWGEPQSLPKPADYSSRVTANFTSIINNDSTGANKYPDGGRKEFDYIVQGRVVYSYYKDYFCTNRIGVNKVMILEMG